MSVYFTVGRQWNGVELMANGYSYGGQSFAGTNFLIVSCNDVAESECTLLSCESYVYMHNSVANHSSITFYYKFCTLTKSGTTFTVNDVESSWRTVTVADGMSTAYYTMHLTGNGLGLDMSASDCVGVLIQNTDPYTTIWAMWGGIQTGTQVDYYSTTSASPYTGSQLTYDSGSEYVYDAFVYGICEATEGDLPTPNYYGDDVPNACQTWTTDIESPGWYNGYGYIRIDDILTSPYRATIAVKTPWLSEHFNITAYENSTDESDTIVFRNPLDLTECYSVRMNSLFRFSGYEGVSELRECWYYETPNNERWVSTGGSDSNTGMAQSRAFRTLTKAIDDIDEGGTIHIAEGFYAGETGITAISKSVQLSPENVYWQKDTCTVLLSSASATTTDYGTVSTNTGWGGDINANMLAFATAIPVPSSGTIVSIQASVTVYAGTVYAIVARPTSGTTYEVIYRQEFDTYTGGDVKEVAIDTCSVSVQSGDVVGYYISNGAVIWRNRTASSWRGGYYTFNTAVGGTFNMASYNESTTTTVGIKYTLMSA